MISQCGQLLELGTICCMIVLRIHTYRDSESEKEECLIIIKVLSMGRI